jgi:Tol biopolymer transport system component/DNA-binding winged helix-turn-helix (wHTH) protein
LKEKHLYTFGDFCLNVEDHTLTRDGQTVPITPKMFDLLLVLIQHPRKVLRKDFLLQSVWPDSFVEEGNITFNIRQLRKALGDDAQEPRYIETIPRRGYRFLMPVESFTTVTPDKTEEAIAQPGPVVLPAVPRHRTRPLVLLATSGLVVLVAALVIGGWYFQNGRSGSALILSAPLSSERLSTDGGVFHIAISPDGKNVVYTHRTAGKQSLWLRQLETSNNVPIIPPSDEDLYLGLAISPDGNFVYFVRGTQREPLLTVYRMPIFGGVPQKVTDGTQGWISLSASGDKISYIRCPYTDEEYCALYIADAADGQNEKKLVSRPRPIRIGDNKISPDGKTVAFAVGQSRTSSNEFAFGAVDVETGVERELTPQKFFNIGYIAWLPDQSGLLMTAMQLPDRNYRIWQVSGSTGEATKLTSDTETYSRLGLDARGTILVSTQVDPDFRLMLFQTDNPTAAPRIIGNANTVGFAPDGRVYFSSARTGDHEIWSANPDGGELKQLTNNPSGDIVPLLPPDSRTVFFQSDRSGTVHVWRMNPDGTDQRQVTSVEGGYPLRVSGDGRWLYYRSALNNTLRRVALDTGNEEMVMKEMGRNLVVSPDATLAAFTRRENLDTVLSVVSVSDSQVFKTWRITGATNVAHLVWSGDGQYLAYVIADDAREIGELWFQKLNSDTPQRIADLSGDEIAELSGFSLSQDGKTFAVIKGNWKHDAVLFRGLK